MKSYGALPRFLSLTFAVTWIFFIAAVMLPEGKDATGKTLAASQGLLVFLGTMAPGLVALLLTVQTEGTPGVRTLLRRVFAWQHSARWYLFAIAYMAVIKLVVALSFRVMTGSWPLVSHESVGVVLASIIISTPFQSGEEIGWRGYALPLLAERMKFASASVVLGLIWATWHLPLFFLRVPGNKEYGQPFPVWAVGVTALSVAFAWLYRQTNGSLLLIMLMHAAVNNIPHFESIAATDASGVFSLHASTVALMTSVFLAIAASYFLVRMKTGNSGAREEHLGHQKFTDERTRVIRDP